LREGHQVDDLMSSLPRIRRSRVRDPALAVRFIRKPVKNNVLLARVARVLKPG